MALDRGFATLQGDVVPLTDAGRQAMAAGMDAAFAVTAEAEARGQAGNGCVIVDPGTGEIVASGGDNSVAHPLK
jgi:tRNA(Arg) A34 adenosine deaminase TadA